MGDRNNKNETSDFFLVLQQSASFRLDGRKSTLGFCLYLTSFMLKIHFLVVGNHKI